MNDLRETPRIDAGQMIVIRPEGSTAEPPVEAMVLNMSLDGALIETRDPLAWESMALTNEYKHQRMTIRASVVHQTDYRGGAWLFGPYRTGVRFIDNHEKAREFIFSVVKCKEKAAGGFQADGSDLPSDWMDTNQINEELFSLDAIDDEEIPPPEAEAVTETPLRKTSPAVPKTAVVAPPAAAPKRHEPVRPPMTNTRPPDIKRTGSRLIPVFLGIAALILAASFVVFRSPPPRTSEPLSWMERLGLDIPFLGSRPPAPKTPGTDIPPPPPAVLIRESITSTVISSKHLGPLFVIRGTLTIQEGYPPERIRIDAALLDASRHPVATVQARPGHRADDGQIVQFGRSDLDRIGQQMPDVPATGQTPFLVIFSNVPGNIGSYTVELTFQGP
jgi:hypothetical protein